MKNKKEKTGIVSIQLDFQFTLYRGVDFDEAKAEIEHRLLRDFRYYDTTSSSGYSVKFKDARLVEK